MTDSTTLALLLPEIILIVAATLIYIAGAFGLPQRAATWFALGGLLIAAVALCGQSSAIVNPETAASHTSGPLAVDFFGYTALGNFGSGRGADPAVGAPASF